MTTCKHCGQIFIWTKTNKGKKPLNRSDGREHWSTCSGFRADGKRRRKAQKKGPLTRFTAKTVGEHFREPCKCSRLPWEDCQDCAHLFQRAVDLVNESADLDLRLLLAEQA